MSKRIGRILSAVSTVINVYLAWYCGCNYGFVASMGWICAAFASVRDYIIYRTDNRLQRPGGDIYKDKI